MYKNAGLQNRQPIQLLSKGCVQEGIAGSEGADVWQRGKKLLP